MSKKKQKPAEPNQTTGPSPALLAGGKKWETIQVWIVFLFGCLLYVNTLGHQYAVDDTIVIVKNNLTQQGFAGIPKIMTTDAFYGFFGEKYQFVAGGRYRPLSIVTFAIENQFLGDNPFVGHLINVLLYGLSCVVLFWLLQLLFRSSTLEPYRLSIPFIATLIFAAHPLHTEAVANIKGRDEIMGLLGSLLALFYVVKFVRNEKMLNLGLAMLWFIFGLLSKENTITFLAVIPLTLWCFTEAKPRHYLLSLLPLIVLSAVYLFLRQTFTPVDFTAKTQEVLNDAFVYATPSERLATISNIMGRYLKLLFIPHPLSHDYYYNEVPMINWSNPGAILPLLINLGLGIYGLWAVLKKKDPIGYGILFYFITVSIVSNIVVSVGTTMSERFLYMPSVGFAIALAVLIGRLAARMEKVNFAEILKKGLDLKPTVPIILVGVITLAYGFRTVTRNPAWENDFVLFGTDIHTSTNSAKLHNAYGGSLVDFADRESNEAKKQEMLQEAVRVLNRAIEIYPNYLNAWLLLGNAHYKLTKDADLALRYYRKTLELNPNYFEGNYNMGCVLAEKDRHKEAVPFFKKSYQAKPQIYEPYYNLAESFFKMGQGDSAIYYYQRAMEKKPNESLFIYKIGVTYGRVINDLDNSIRFLSQALSMQPDNPTYIEDLGVAYGIKGDLANAEKQFSLLVQKTPNSGKAWFNLGLTYRNQGKEDKALQAFQKAAELDPQYRMQ